MQDGAVPVLQGGVGVAVRAGFQARGGGCGGGEGDRSGGDGNEVVGEEVPARPVIPSPIVSVVDQESEGSDQTIYQSGESSHPMGLAISVQDWQDRWAQATVKDSEVNDVFVSHIVLSNKLNDFVSWIFEFIIIIGD